MTTLFGITPFPYDFSAEAVARVRETIAANSTLFALHLDDGIPWKEALEGLPLPARIQRDWDEQVRSIPKGRPVYVAIAPLAEDRESLAPATGEERRLPMPEELKGRELDDPKVERAYLNYVRLVVKEFHPQFLNVGIEGGEIMARNFSKWPRFERLFESVRGPIKAENPDVQIGISFGLGDLRSPREAEAARDLIAKCDYVGLSFYPYASAFDEKFGALPYRGPTPWREPLDWIRRYTKKPIAICETGFTSQDIEIPRYGLSMQGSPSQQARYVKELFETARRDRYAFVVWFLAVDYDKLYAKMPAGSEAMLLWEHSGFFDSDMRPKPAWAEWQRGLSSK